MIYFIEPKQPTNLEASCRIMQSVKRQPSDRKVVGSIPAHTSGFFGFLFLFPKKKYVRAFSQPATTNQPVVIFGIMRSEKRKISPRGWRNNYFENAYERLMIFPVIFPGFMWQLVFGQLRRYLLLRQLLLKVWPISSDFLTNNTGWPKSRSRNPNIFRGNSQFGPPITPSLRPEAYDPDRKGRRHQNQYHITYPTRQCVSSLKMQESPTMREENGFMQIVKDKAARIESL